MLRSARQSRIATDRASARLAYERDFVDVRALWLRLTEVRPGAAVQTYAGVVGDPGADPVSAWAVARLLADLGHQAQAVTLQRFLVTYYRTAQNDARLAASLVNLAAAVRQTGDIDGARAALEQAEGAAARAGEPTVTAAAQQNLGSLLRDIGQLDGALAAFAREEALARESGMLDRAGAAVGMRGAVLGDRGDADGALACLALLPRESGGRTTPAR